MLGRRARLLAIWVLAAVSTTALGQAAEIASSSETPPASLAYDLVRDLTTLFGPRSAGSAAEAAAAARCTLQQQSCPCRSLSGFMQCVAARSLKSVTRTAR